MKIKETLNEIKARFTKKNIDCILTLLPLSLYGVILYGIRALLICAVSITSTVIFQYIINNYIEKNEEYDYLESIAGGLFFAILLPPTLPLYIVVIGTCFAVFIVRLFLRNDNGYLLSPALLSRAFLQFSFPTQMSSFFEPMSDIVASSTPLSNNYYSLKEIVFGVTSGCIGETSSILIIICGVYLILVKFISWEIPVSIITSSIIFAAYLGQNPLQYICSGGLLVGAFFLNIDNAVLPKNRFGMIVYGICCSIIIAIFRMSLGHQEGVSYAIIFMSLLVPIINSIRLDFLRKKAQDE